MSRKRRLLILTLVLAVAIPVGLDSMGKVFAGAVGFSSKPGANGVHDGSGSHAAWDTLQAAWHGKSHRPVPPQADVVDADSNGKRFEEAANNGNGKASAPWLDSGFPKELWHSDDFNSFDAPNSGNGTGGGSGSANGAGGGSNSQGGAPNSGGEILGGGPGNSGGKSTTTPSAPSSDSGSVDGGTPVAPTPEPGTMVLFIIGIAGTAKPCWKRIKAVLTAEK